MYNFSCRLCIEINDFEKSLFAEKYPNLLSQNVFFERSRLQVMLPIGPFCEGHLLIALKKHEWSFGHLGKNILPELAELIDEISCFLKTHLHRNRIIVFEHGPVSMTQRGGCCLEHAHMNTMPIPDSFALFNTASKFITFVPTELHQLEDFIRRGEPYLFFSCPREGSFAAVAPIGSTQFFRKLLASTTPGKSWDWRSDPNFDTVKAMVALLKSFSKESFHNVT